MTTLNFQLAHAVARTMSPGDEIVVTALDHDANVSPWLVVAGDHDLVGAHRAAAGRGHDARRRRPGGADRRAHASGRVHARLERGRLDSGCRPHRRGRARCRARSPGRTRCTGAAPAAACTGGRTRRPALLALQVLRSSPRDRVDPARPGGVTPGGPGAAGRRGPARAPLRDRHAVARGHRGRARRDRVPARPGRGRSRRGLRPIEEHETSLTARFLSGLPDGVELYGIRTPEGRTPTFCFNIEGRAPARGGRAAGASATSTSGTATTTPSSRCERSASPTAAAPSEPASSTTRPTTRSTACSKH